MKREGEYLLCAINAALKILRNPLAGEEWKGRDRNEHQLGEEKFQKRKKMPFVSHPLGRSIHQDSAPLPLKESGAVRGRWKFCGNQEPQVVQ